ncbi:hypothetical protein [Salinirubrum litoreum]|uniref:Uncharacterized protein n=1 Tax=Salinirubrum litoreum TaxID=1126234 RepID=A0ABD5RCH7_9EURY|nr:hypothetical protein [Salinirubrum litoreum]
MSVLDSSLDSRRLLRGALPASLLVAVASTVLALLRALPTGDPTELLGVSPAPVAFGVLLSTVTTVPFLLALLVVVTTPSRRVAAAGAGLVYAVDLVAVVAGRSLLSRGAGLDVAVLALPLPRAVTVLAVATAVWLAYHGGTERLHAVVGGVPPHPLFAQIADHRLGPGLTLQRGLLAAGVAGLVGAGGLVVAGGLYDLLTAVGGLGAPGSPSITFSESGLREVGISLARLPVRWLIEASVLLAVLFVAGPRCSPRDLLKGLGLLVAVRSAVILVPAFLPPFEPVFLLGPRGPLVAALPDVILLVGIAFAVRLSESGSPESPVDQPTATADS